MFVKQSGALHYRIGVAIAFACTLGLIAAGGVLSWSNARAQDRSAAVVIRTHHVMAVLNQVESTMTDAETGQRGYLLTGDEQFLEPYLAATGLGAAPGIQRPPISALLASTHKLMLATDTERELLYRIDGLVRRKLAELAQTIALRRAGHSAEALAILREGRGKRTMDALRATLSEMRGQEQEQLAQSEIQRQQAARHAYLSGIGSAVVGLAAIVCLLLAGRRAERGLLRQEEQFHMLADNISQHAWTASADGRFEWFNQRWHAYTGLDGADLGAQWRLASDHPVHRDRVERGLRHAVATGTPWEDICPLRARDGNWQWFLVRAVPIRGPGGAVLRWFGTNTDIDQRLRLEEALKDANRRKDEFIATLAHELRNPLAPIQAGLELMRVSPAFPSALTRTREIMSRQMNHLVRVIGDLLDVSRISTGRVALEREVVPLRAIVDSALDTCRPQIEQSNHTLELDLPAETLLVDADPQRLAQVLGNLLSNAARYTPEGGLIRIVVERAGPEVLIRVADNGIGIDPAMLPHVFDLFSHGPRGLEQSHGGIGMGLSIARQLVQMHDGTLSADSAGLGEGSTFTIHLPLAQADRLLAPATVAAAVAGQRRILILDDNLDAAQTLGNLLGLAGHSVQLAHSGRDAIELAARFAPELAFLDIGLPDMSGYDVARALRTQPELRSACLVALTGWGAPADRLKSTEAGIDLHLTKPVSLDGLAAALPELALPSRQGA